MSHRTGIRAPYCRRWRTPSARRSTEGRRCCGLASGAAASRAAPLAARGRAGRGGAGGTRTSRPRRSPASGIGAGAGASPSSRAATARRVPSRRWRRPCGLTARAGRRRGARSPQSRRPLRGSRDGWLCAPAARASPQSEHVPCRRKKRSSRRAAAVEKVTKARAQLTALAQAAAPTDAEPQPTRIREVAAEIEELLRTPEKNKIHVEQHLASEHVCHKLQRNLEELSDLITGMQERRRAEEAEEGEAAAEAVEQPSVDSSAPGPVEEPAVEQPAAAVPTGPEECRTSAAQAEPAAGETTPVIRVVASEGVWGASPAQEPGSSALEASLASLSRALESLADGRYNKENVPNQPCAGQSFVASHNAPRASAPLPPVVGPCVLEFSPPRSVRAPRLPTEGENSVRAKLSFGSPPRRGPAMHQRRHPARVSRSPPRSAMRPTPVKQETVRAASPPRSDLTQPRGSGSDCQPKAKPESLPMSFCMAWTVALLGLTVMFLFWVSPSRSAPRHAFEYS
mmetsp:Transcript_110420/g.252795  ORF Transcript_110420/g.252795 Transcript_110420/m.252795 type:complete len:512 (-) Transcript_110420:148-1683(-)